MLGSLGSKKDSSAIVDIFFLPFLVLFSFSLLLMLLRLVTLTSTPEEYPCCKFDAVRMVT